MKRTGDDPGPRILVVDDDRINRRLVVRGLTEIGSGEIHEAEDGVEAKELLAAHDVDVVITDVMMPRMDGLALIRWAKEHCPDAVWIILSGLDTFDAAVEAIHLGAFDFLAKPPNLKELEVSVRNALAHRQLLRDKEALQLSLEERVLQLEGLCRILGEQAERIDQDLRRAEVIQGALLPKLPPAMNGISVNALYRPGRFVGGDLYDVISIDDDRVAIYVADASGHGVSAAMLSVVFKQRLRAMTAAGVPVSPGAALEKVNRALYADVTAPGMFVTAVYCLIDTRAGLVTMASAGHPPVCLARAGGRMTLLEKTGPALGLHAAAEFTERREALQPGDRLLLYSDGLEEPSVDEKGWWERLAEMLRAEEMSPTSVLQDLLRSVAPSADQDDITLVLVDHRDAPSHFDNGSGEESRAEPSGRRPSCSLHFGETSEATVLAVRGRGTYLQSQAFFDAVRAVVEGRRGLTLDLSGCDYLDSTFLGMIHEIVDRCERQGVAVDLHGVKDPVRRLFEELSLEVVLRHVRDAEGVLPELQPLAGASGDESALHRRILRAHDVLVSLSAENREKFQAVVDSLRRELPESPGAAPRPSC